MKIGNLIFNFPIDIRNNFDICRLKYISQEIVVENGKYLVGSIIRNDYQKISLNTMSHN